MRGLCAALAAAAAAQQAAALFAQRRAAQRDDPTEQLLRQLDGLIAEQQRQGTIIRKLLDDAHAGKLPGALRGAVQGEDTRHRTEDDRPVAGVHFDADYDVWHPKPSLPQYELRPGAPFRYPLPAPGMPRFYLMSNQPKVYFFPALLTAAEADGIVAAATAQLARSGVAPYLSKSTSNGAVSEVRTSSGAWLDDDVPAARSVRDKIQTITGFTRNPDQPPGDAYNGQYEKLQILRYTRGQKYDQHSDYFEPAMYGPQTGNRAATFFLYLSTVEEGGETILPRANGAPHPMSYSSCSQGLRVHPRKGSALLFYDMRPDMVLDEYSLHGGCPVKRGVKWAAAQWLRVPGKWDNAHGRQGFPDPEGKTHA